MLLTFGKARELLARYVGSGGACADTEKTKFFVYEVLQYMLINAPHGSTKKFCFNAVKGCITLPYELEVPLKVKIGREIGTVWNKWFEFHDTRILEDCIPASQALQEEPNYYSTVYDLPSCGARIGVAGNCKEDEGAHVRVFGTDPNGREIFVPHKGEHGPGEHLTIQSGRLSISTAIFKKITGVQKTQTNGYATLYWVDTTKNTKGFLSDYSPLEVSPSYRRFKLNTKYCKECTEVAILGRIRLKDDYADKDFLPFNNIHALHLAAQSVQAQNNNNMDVAQAKDSALEVMITRENEYKKINNGQPMEIYVPLSGGSIRNIV